MAEKEELKRAMSAFKKRLKLYRQDDESRLGGRGMTGGRVSGIVGIKPPDGFAPEIWEELVEKGKLRSEGSGTYSIVDATQPQP